GVETQTTKISQEVAQLRDELKALREERAATQREALQAQTYREIDEAISAKSPLLAQYGTLARDAVFEHISDAFARSNGRVLLSYEQAISAVESEFRGLVTKALSVESLRE